MLCSPGCRNGGWRLRGKPCTGSLRPGFGRRDVGSLSTPRAQLHCLWNWRKYGTWRVWQLKRNGWCASWAWPARSVCGVPRRVPGVTSPAAGWGTAPVSALFPWRRRAAGSPVLTCLDVRLSRGNLCDPRAAQGCHHGPVMPSRDLLLALTPSCHPSDMQGPGGASPSGVCPPGGLLGEKCFLPVGGSSLSAAWSHWARLRKNLPETGVSREEEPGGTGRACGHAGSSHARSGARPLTFLLRESVTFFQRKPLWVSVSCKL